MLQHRQCVFDQVEQSLQSQGPQTRDPHLATVAGELQNYAEELRHDTDERFEMRCCILARLLGNGALLAQLLETTQYHPSAEENEEAERSSC
mmetsp:Transcript_23786/g.52705  ORF Transcript_23786/g.52705 Transcript_23786/m.52705 type:complete len:92 (-) Transcript_23786:17-292(-)